MFTRKNISHILTRHTIILLALGLGFATVLGGTLIATFAAGVSCPNRADTVYRVLPGDTLSGIAAAHNTTFQQLATYNAISDANIIYPLQAICIPAMQQIGMPIMPQNNYVAIARQDATAEHVNPDLFVRQINQESGFNPNAISPAGAIGIAQFEPATAASLGINPHDPVQSLQGAAHLMASYWSFYGGDYQKALAAYNAGGGAVGNAVANCGTNWLRCMPAETQNYVHVILG